MNAHEHALFSKILECIEMQQRKSRALEERILHLENPKQPVDSVLLDQVEKMLRDMT